MKSFLQVWMTGYYRPSLAVEQLRDKPAPQWGLYGALIRSVLVSLFWYLPAHLLHRQTASPPVLTIFNPQSYYLAMIIIFPVFTLMSWVLDSALVHVILRLTGRQSDIDQILNINGMGYLIIGPLLVAWDWITLAFGWESAVVTWGLIHLIIDLWYIIFVITGLKRILHLPLWLAAALVAFLFIYSVPLAMLFIRP